MGTPIQDANGNWINSGSDQDYNYVSVQTGIPVDILRQMVSDGYDIRADEAGSYYWARLFPGSDGRTTARDGPLSTASPEVYGYLYKQDQQNQGANSSPWDPSHMPVPPPAGPSEQEKTAYENTLRRGYAIQQGRLLRGALEMGARSGAGADQLGGQVGDVSAAYGAASETEIAKQKLTFAIQEQAAKLDYYNKAFAWALSEAQARQGTADAAKAFQYAQMLAAQGESAQRRLIALQQYYNDQISGKDILGAILGTGLRVGATALGTYLGGPAGGAAANAGTAAAGDLLPDVDLGKLWG